MSKTLTIHIQKPTVAKIANELTVLPSIQIFDNDSRAVERFSIMCTAIEDDIQSAEGSGADILEAIRRVEHHESHCIEADGNAWVCHITEAKVWFECLYGEIVGGEVSFAQYKRAVQLYIQFLRDPERSPLKMDFPER